MDKAAEVASDMFELLYKRDLVKAKLQTMRIAYLQYMEIAQELITSLQTISDAEVEQDIVNAKSIISDYNTFINNDINIDDIDNRAVIGFCKTMVSNKFFDSLSECSNNHYLVGSKIDTDVVFNDRMKQSIADLYKARNFVDMMMPGNKEDFSKHVKRFYDREVRSKFHKTHLVTDRLMIEIYSLIELNLEPLYISYVDASLDGLAKKFKSLCETSESVCAVIQSKKSKKVAKKGGDTTKSRAILTLIPELKIVAGIIIAKVQSEGQKSASLASALDLVIDILKELNI